MDIQTDRSDPALIHAIRANLNAFFRHVAETAPEGEFVDEHFTRWSTPIPHPWFNGAISSRQPRDGDSDFIEASLSHFRSKNLPSCTWWLDPPLECADWQPMLSRYGFHVSSDTPGMALELETLHEPAQDLDGLDVRVVADAESLRAWAKVFTIGYGLPPDWEKSVHQLQLQLGLGFPVRNYVGFINGEPVATSCLFLGAGVAGIYSVATLPKARGKGIGSAVTLRALQNARELGYHIGILQSSDMGYNVYKRLGFRQLCQIEYFYLSLSGSSTA